MRSCSARSSAPTRCSGPGRRTEYVCTSTPASAHAGHLPLDEGVAGARVGPEEVTDLHAVDPAAALAAQRATPCPEVDPGRPAQDVLRHARWSSAAGGTAPRRARVAARSGASAARGTTTGWRRRARSTSASVTRYGSRISCGASGTSGVHCGDVLADGGEVVVDDVQRLADRRVVLDRGDEGVGDVLHPCHRQDATGARTEPPRSGELDAEQRVPELAGAVDHPGADDGRAPTPLGDELLLDQLDLCVLVTRVAARPRSGASSVRTAPGASAR